MFYIMNTFYHEKRSEQIVEWKFYYIDKKILHSGNSWYNELKKLMLIACG